MQRRVVEAELGHHVTLKKGTKAEFLAQMESKVNSRAVTMAIDRIFKTFKGTKGPRARTERMSALWDIFLHMD